MISDLQAVIAGGIDELREERAEEDQGLGIAERHDDTLHDEAAARRSRRLTAVPPLDRIIFQPSQIR